MNYYMRFLGTFVILATTLFSCQPDPCLDLMCGDHGNCQEAICICDTGYTLDTVGLCNSEIRAKYLGKRYSLDYCSSGKRSYTLNVSNSSTDLFKIEFDNIYNKNKTVSARISSENTNQFTIGLQPFNLGTIEGFGYLTPSSNTIRMTYYVKVLSAIDTCHATMIPSL